MSVDYTLTLSFSASADGDAVPASPVLESQVSLRPSPPTNQTLTTDQTNSSADHGDGKFYSSYKKILILTVFLTDCNTLQEV